MQMEKKDAMETKLDTLSLVKKLRANLGPVLKPYPIQLVYLNHIISTERLQVPKDVFKVLSKQPRSKLRGIRGRTGVDPYGEG